MAERTHHRSQLPLPHCVLAVRARRQGSEAQLEHPRAHSLEFERWYDCGVLLDVCVRRGWHTGQSWVVDVHDIGEGELHRWRGIHQPRSSPYYYYFFPSSFLVVKGFVVEG